VEVEGDALRGGDLVVDADVVVETAVGRGGVADVNVLA